MFVNILIAKNLKSIINRYSQLNSVLGTYVSSSLLCFLLKERVVYHVLPTTLVLKGRPLSGFSIYGCESA